VRRKGGTGNLEQGTREKKKDIGILNPGRGQRSPEPVFSVSEV
jgi:hypothetical protein